MKHRHVRRSMSKDVLVNLRLAQGFSGAMYLQVLGGNNCVVIAQQSLGINSIVTSYVYTQTA